jgi:AcrR family transcriptional regulator
VEQRELSEIQIRILDAAAGEFMQSGFDGTSIDDIARSIGQTKGLIYYHFRSKIEIFYAVYERGMRMVHEEVAPLAAGEGSGFERLRKMASTHLANLMSRLAYHDVIHQGIDQRLRTRLTDRQRQALAELGRMRDEYEALFQTVIAEGIADGSVREIPSAIAARALLGGLNAVDIWYRNKQGEYETAVVDDMASTIADVLVRGFQPAA